jgi:hypothetical protein
MPTRILFDRKFDARPDRFDFRDLPYSSRLVSLPPAYPSDQLIERWFSVYRSADMVLDQGQEGSCTGFGLAAVVNYLQWELANTNPIAADDPKAAKTIAQRSARMLYQNARLYDEWKGEDYEGSSCRGAMKGFHKHGVCGEKFWPNFEKRQKPGLPKSGWDADAPLTPLGAYYRIDGKSIVDMQSAVYETHAIYVSADVHDGWDRVRKNCKTLDAALILPPKKPYDVGGHAFALVGYTSDGFIVQNSWGPGWGFHGFGLLPYEDWTRYGTDAWALALGAPMRAMLPPIKGKKGAANLAAQSHHFVSPSMRTDLSLDERLRSRAMLRSDVAGDESAVSPWINGEEAKHIIFIGHNGSAERELVEAASGDDAVALVVQQCLDRAAQQEFSDLAIILHGGLNSRDDGIGRARVLGPWFEANRIMPIFVVWQTGLLESAGDILKTAAEKLVMPSGADKGWLRSKIDEIKDRAFEVFARDAGVKAIWENMKFGARARARSDEQEPAAADSPHRTFRRSHHERVFSGSHESPRPEGQLHPSLGTGLHGRLCIRQIRQCVCGQGRRSRDDVCRCAQRCQRNQRSVRPCSLLQIAAVPGFPGPGAQPQDADSGIAEGLAEMAGGRRHLHVRFAKDPGGLVGCQRGRCPRYADQRNGSSDASRAEQGRNDPRQSRLFRQQSGRREPCHPPHHRQGAFQAGHRSARFLERFRAKWIPGRAKKNAPKQDSRAAFRFYRNGMAPGPVRRP